MIAFFRKVTIDLILLSLVKLPSVHGLDVLYLLENDEVFDKCELHLGQGIHDLFDMSNMKFEINEYNMNVVGSVEVIWDVKPTDRISLNIEVLKYIRGTWQPTLLSIVRNDFCSAMFSPSEMWYDAVMAKIKPPERQCLNIKGLVYHIIEPINEYMKFSTMQKNSVDGRHKFVVKLDAFDENGVKRPNDICFEIKGEFVKGA